LLRREFFGNVPYATVEKAIGATAEIRPAASGWDAKVASLKEPAIGPAGPAHCAPRRDMAHLPVSVIAIAAATAIARTAQIACRGDGSG